MIMTYKYVHVQGSQIDHVIRYADVRGKDDDTIRTQCNIEAGHMIKVTVSDEPHAPLCATCVALEPDSVW
jgi:hypothetical protein